MSPHGCGRWPVWQPGWGRRQQLGTQGPAPPGTEVLRPRWDRSGSQCRSAARRNPGNVLTSHPLINAHLIFFPLPCVI